MPFMSAPVARVLVRAADAARVKKRRLITAVTVSAIEGGYLDPQAAQAMVDAGFDVRSLRNLHAKVVITDSTWGLVGSGNLTGAGTDGGNAELGVVLSAKQTRQARRDHFEPLWDAAEPVDLPAMHRLALPGRPEEAGAPATRRAGRRLPRSRRQGVGGRRAGPEQQRLLAEDHVRRRPPHDRGRLAEHRVGQRRLTRSSAVNRSAGRPTPSATTLSPTSRGSTGPPARPSCGSSTRRVTTPPSSPRTLPATRTAGRG